ncbi:unnamed protein product, partial [Mesorhabditis belari]|uniref:Uncharacterized protein n=1 Tax=Mesorhabditis belari TaxID=2138241 RepID=A0AAF3J9R0_9BILA
MVVHTGELCLIAAASLTTAAFLFTLAGTFGDDWVHVDTTYGFSLTVGMLPSRCSDMPEDMAEFDPNFDINKYCDQLRKGITRAIGHKTAALLVPALLADLLALCAFGLIWWKGFKARKFALPVACVLQMVACVLPIIEAAHVLNSVKGNKKLEQDQNLTTIGLGWCIDILIVGGVAAAIAVPLTFTSLVTRPAPPISPSEITIRSPTIVSPSSRKTPLD